MELLVAGRRQTSTDACPCIFYPAPCRTQTSGPLVPLDQPLSVSTEVEYELDWSLFAAGSDRDPYEGALQIAVSQHHHPQGVRTSPSKDGACSYTDSTVVSASSQHQQAQHCANYTTPTKRCTKDMYSTVSSPAKAVTGGDAAGAQGSMGYQHVTTRPSSVHQHGNTSCVMNQGPQQPVIGQPGTAGYPGAPGHLQHAAMVGHQQNLYRHQVSTHQLVTQPCHVMNTQQLQRNMVGGLPALQDDLTQQAVPQQVMELPGTPSKARTPRRILKATRRTARPNHDLTMSYGVRDVTLSSAALPDADPVAGMQWTSGMQQVGLQTERLVNYHQQHHSQQQTTLSQVVVPHPAGVVTNRHTRQRAWSGRHHAMMDSSLLAQPLQAAEFPTSLAPPLARGVTTTSLAQPIVHDVTSHKPQPTNPSHLVPPHVVPQPQGTIILDGDDDVTETSVVAMETSVVNKTQGTSHMDVSMLTECTESAAVPSDTAVVPVLPQEAEDLVTVLVDSSMSFFQFPEDDEVHDHTTILDTSLGSERYSTKHSDKPGLQAPDSIYSVMLHTPETPSRPSPEFASCNFKSVRTGDSF